MSDDKPQSPSDGPASHAAIRESLMAGARTLQSQRDDGDDAYEPPVIEQMKSLGFAGDAVRAFDLLPLLVVAWADGAIQAEERTAILQLLRRRGLEATPVYAMFEALLRTRPAEVYLNAAVALLRQLVVDRPDGGASVVQMCIAVAAAASDALGSPDPISEEERAAIAGIAQSLGPTAIATVRRKLYPA